MGALRYTGYVLLHGEMLHHFLLMWRGGMELVDKQYLAALPCVLVGTKCFGWIVKSAEAYDLPKSLPIMKRFQRSLFKVLDKLPEAEQF